MNLEKWGDICSCIISAVGLGLKAAVSFVEPLKWRVALWGIQYHAT